MTIPHPFFTYTSEVLSWRLGDPVPAPPPAEPGAGSTAVRAGRVLRAAAGRRRILLLGLGTGDLAAALAAGLPQDTSLCVCGLDPAGARRLRAAGGLDWAGPDTPAQLLADTSVQALFCLLTLTGWSDETALVTVNPEPADPGERAGLSRLRRLLAGSGPAPAPLPAFPPVTLAVLARTDEPDLAGFFQAAADLAERAVIVWDAEDAPRAGIDAARALKMPVRHLARRLDRDFATQRNALLAACPEGWILTLDPDERPGPGFGAAVRRIAATPGCGGAFFPRLTLYPDARRAKVGYGLWPDLQLRLFSTAGPSRPRYVRPVHEHLEGLTGRTGLAPLASILHFNRLLCPDDAVAAKLTAFSAAPGAPRHHLSGDYPTLPREFFETLAQTAPAPDFFFLPPGV